MMDVGGRRVLCWVQTGLPVKKPKPPKVPQSEKPPLGEPSLPEKVTILEGILKELQGELRTLEKSFEVDANPFTARVSSLEEHLKVLQGELTQKEKALRERMVSLEKTIDTLKGEKTALQGIVLNLQNGASGLWENLKALEEGVADSKHADLPLEVLKLMHGALFETSQRYRAFLKGYSGKLPKWADDRETLET
jgi:chromosome segregation ATPase